jgi:branched-subunit amino acid aminotransferase/4-amino-4-deoxychorismate lyase
MKRNINPLTNSAFKYGLGFYETMRAINKNIIFYDEHIKRLSKSLKDFKLPTINIKDIYKTLIERIEKKNIKDARIRITYSLQGKNLQPFLTYEVVPFVPSFQKQAKIKLSDYILKHSDRLRQHKTTSNFIYFLEFLKAREHNYDEVIFIDDAGHILEGSRTNIFFIFYGEKPGKFYLKTPSLDCGILHGIAREKVIKLCKELRIKILEEPLDQKIFNDADEIFLTNSVHGIIPLKSIPGSKRLYIERTEFIKHEFAKRYLITY